jgi:hypothetical protein
MEKMVFLTESELNNLIRSAVADELSKRINVKPPTPTIKGIHGLAEALNCSVSKAQKIKDSGVIRFFQNGKLLLFDYNQILEDLQNENIHKRGRRSKNI